MYYVCVIKCFYLCVLDYDVLNYGFFGKKGKLDIKEVFVDGIYIVFVDDEGVFFLFIEKICVACFDSLSDAKYCIKNLASCDRFFKLL